MRLLNCQLQNVRQHGELELSFSPRLTLIGGPNESGKSTLVEALHRALFLRATATGAPVEALQSRVHLGQPIVQLSFEAKGDQWSLRKRFSGATGQVNLKAAGSANPLTGPAAEEVLAELVGVAETLGSRQAGNVLPSRWAHLWVRQGVAGDDLLAKGKDGYDFDRLRLQLERSGGAAVQQSARDQLVEQRILAALEENFTSRGTKKHSPLYRREEALSDASERMAGAQARQAEFESASDDLAVICQQLEQLQRDELPALQERQKQLAEGAETAVRLDGAINLARRTLEPIRLRHGAADQALRQLDALGAEIGQREQSRTELQARAVAAQSRESEFTTGQQRHIASRDGLKLQLETLEKRQQLLLRLVESTAAAEALQRLNADLDKQRQNAAQREALSRELAALPSLSKKQLSKIRQLEQTLRDARTRQQAMAAGLKLLKADQPVRLDGQPLQVGAEQRLSTVFQLEVGDGVVLEIAPGGGEALGDLQRTITLAAESLTAELSPLGVATVEAAADLLEQRTALEQQQAALSNAATSDAARVQQQRDQLQQRQNELQIELQGLSAVRSALEAEAALPTALAELQAFEQQISRTLHHTRTAARAAEQELEATRSELQRLQQQRLSEAGQLQVVCAELEDRQKRLTTLISQQGDREAQVAALATLSQQLQQAEQALKTLEVERAALGHSDAEREQQQLQTTIDAMSQRIAQLLDQRGAAKQRCDSISSEDPFAAVEQAGLQLETAEVEHQQLLRVIEAHKLLKDAFDEAQADLSSRYSDPLASAIGDYLRPLVPDGQVARLDYDQNKGFQGLQLRRGQDFYAFDTLSGGMREQLAAALRLSMADVLKGAHDGCLPLVFDDAFTNSDPERIDLVKRMLGTAVDRGLQVILLTCDPAAYGTFADQVVELGNA
jgi:energy-coupling factor transporter ATP-binding protein EcfA2